MSFIRSNSYQTNNSVNSFNLARIKRKVIVSLLKPNVTTGDIRELFQSANISVIQQNQTNQQNKIFKGNNQTNAYKLLAVYVNLLNKNKISFLDNLWAKIEKNTDMLEKIRPNFQNIKHTKIYNYLNNHYKPEIFATILKNLYNSKTNTNNLNTPEAFVYKNKITDLIINEIKLANLLTIN
jgi:hypothetical protein